MRKVFAMVATVAIVLSMFSGIAFAAPTYKVLLNNAAVMSSGTSLGPAVAISGAVVVDTVAAGDTEVVGSIYPNAITVEVFDGTGTVIPALTRTSSTGSFVVYIPTNLPAQNLTLKVKDAATVPLATATVPVKYSVVLDNALEYTYNADQVPTAISGTVKDSTGKAVQGATVDIKLNGVSLLAAPKVTDANGFFGDYVKFTASGDLKVFVNGVEHVAGKVAALGMTLTVSPNANVTHTVAPTNFTYQVSGGPASQNVKIEILDSSKAVVHTVTAGTALGADGSLELKNQAWQPSAAGTYTVKATVGSVYEATATIEVVNPATYNLINGSSLEKATIGVNDLTFGAGNIHLARFHIGAGGVPGLDTAFSPNYVVTVDGKVALDQRTVGLVDDPATPWNETNQVRVTATALGTKTIRLQAYEGATLVWDKTFTMTITGWDVSINTQQLTVSTAQDIVVVVKDEKGVAVNNAAVRLTFGADVKTIKPSTHNIQDGTYTFAGVKYATPGVATVEVFAKESDMTAVPPVAAKVTFDVNVLGHNVYSVTSATTGLLLGKATKVQLTVTENGVPFVPAVLKVQIGDGAASAQPFTAVDTNKDGVYDAIETTITPNNTKNITLRAESPTGNKRGDLVLPVKAAKLEVIKGENLTRDFTDMITFRIVNPFDGSVIKENVTLVENYVAITVKDANGGVSGKTLLGAEEYTIQVQSVPSAGAATWAADEAAAKAADKPIAVTLTVYGQPVDGQFLVEPAEIVSNPTEVVIGQANNLVLTYQDANGNPIVGKEVYVGTVANGTLIAKTNDKGQVVYATTGAVSFEAKTETARVVAASVNAVVDTKAPVVTAPETSNTATATITVTDNVRVARLMVNGVELNIIPRSEIKHVVTLKLGENKFDVIAVDNNYNVVEQTVTINYVPAASNQTVLQGAQVARKGENIMLQARQFEELGAKFAWNDATKTATFTVDGTTVEVTVGSLTAKVNGQARTMVVAPYIQDGRIMVHSRFVAEALGWTVNWAAGDIITIIK
ncbi:MAG: copper amine oxidase N-terminal domain-containing protein [Bacillota bacterium]|jgi:hypothetical protein